MAIVATLNSQIQRVLLIGQMGLEVYLASCSNGGLVVTPWPWCLEVPGISGIHQPGFERHVTDNQVVIYSDIKLATWNSDLLLNAKEEKTPIPHGN